MTTTTITATEAPTSTTAPLSHGSPLASLPAWGTPRPALPSATTNPDPDPDPPTTAGTRTSGAAGAGSASSEQGTASIRALFKGRSASYAKIANTLFKAVGGMLNTTAAAAVGDTDAWLPDDEDLEIVPPPLGRIAARRIKFGADPDQLSDLEDIGMAAVGIIMWAAKSVVTLAEARRFRRRLEADKAVHTDAGTGQ